jgi:diguanylate cyclase (GGDEF)-like protein
VIRKTNAIVAVVLALATAALCAQEYSFRGFGTAEGLTNLAIKRIYQDRTGFIWVSTENGIFRYDGERFEGFGPAQGVPSNSGSAFGAAPDGSLLIGGDFGLYRLTGNRFAQIAAGFKSISWAQGIQPDGKGHTYLGTDTGLVEITSPPGREGLQLRTLPRVPGTSGPEAYAVLVDGDTLWYGCGNELCRRDSRGTQVFGRESGLPDRQISTVLKDAAGIIWVRARNAGVFVSPQGHIDFKRPTLPIPSQDLGAVPSVDSDGRILLATSDGLLIVEGKNWQMINRSVGLRGTVYSSFEDRQHSLWIGLAGRGLVQWRGYREWESYSVSSGLSNDLVYEILPRSDGSLWVATEAGLFRGQKKQFGMEFRRVAALGSLAVHSVRQGPDGDVWVGTASHGAARIHSTSGKVQWFGPERGLAGHEPYTLRFTRDHRLWAATEAGLFVAEPPYLKFSRITELPSTGMWAVAEGTDGTMWAGGVDGLFERAAAHWKKYGRADGLSNQEVLSLGAGPNGVMWVGYRFGGGIDRVHPNAGSVTIEKGVQRPGTDGLIYFLNFDSHGRLWAGTERGVDVLDGSRWSNYDTSDGLAWDDCNLNAFAEAPNGVIWIGTSGGLSRFKPRASSHPDAPLEVVFTRLVAGQKDISGLRNPSFGSHSNSLVARYSALNATRENGVVFRYRLVDANSNWTETPQRELQFANLAPGHYTIEVEAQEEDGTWSEHRAEFQFAILTPWFWTWWFVSLCILIPLSIAAGALRLRIVGAQHREAELIRLVEEKTADLRQANRELSLLSFTDPLTGLANRRVFDQTLDRECARLTRKGSTVSLLMLDVDHFKPLNDSEGHQRGDEYLVALGAELTRLCRRQLDLAARVGGEEFAVILSDTDEEEAEKFADSVRLAILDLKLPHPASPVAPFLTVSVGVATGTAKRLGARDALVAAADRALYAAKRRGRNCVCIAVEEEVAENSQTL